MKKAKLFSTTILTLAALMLLQTSCRKDLLTQDPTTDLGADQFWKTEADATYALMGCYASVRPCFDRDYYLDGQADYMRVRSNTLSTTSGNLRLGDAYNNANYNPSGYGGSFDKMYRYLYGGVTRANYVIANVTKMIAENSSANVANLETIIGEAKLLRGMCYFRLISMWGDVPYFTNLINDNTEALSLARLPLKQVKDSIMDDLTYALSKLPAKAVLGRAAKPAALAFRGKLQLYWACWNHFGWPELEGFTPSATEATAAYTAAAADFKSVINDFGLTLYLNGEPGDIDDLGKADKLPNYYYLFNPKTGNTSSELIMVFTHGGTGSGQGEELMRDFSGRSHEGSQCWVAPRYEIADRYQLLTTGDFAPKLIPMNPANNPAARTTLNSAVNPQSYAGRDYRMKATIQWDYEMSIGLTSLQSTGFCPFIYTTWAQPVTINGVKYTTYNTDGCNSGYVFRKFVRNYAGQGRSDGDYAWPVIRLADVYLMYAEATNELNGPQADAIDVVNKVRHRGNLPALDASKTADKVTFFDAIEQERIVELIAEGFRGFDLRRWRAIERVWGPPGGPGKFTLDTYGAQPSRYFQNAPDREYQQDYIFRIPQSERDRNPNLTQNIPWR
jgi:starch-binding outer membrane protein, SusD/RagB family